MLLLTTIKPYHLVTFSTVTHWLESLCKLPGTGTSIFSTHSVRGATIATAANAAISTTDILKTANQYLESIFLRLIYCT